MALAVYTGTPGGGIWVDRTDANRHFVRCRFDSHNWVTGQEDRGDREAGILVSDICGKQKSPVVWIAVAALGGFFLGRRSKG